MAFGTAHLSLYQLTIEEGTLFAHAARNGALAPPEEESAAALFELTQELTYAAGMPAYEISNHARPGEECRHNLIYWRYNDYAGVGPGAHGRLSIDGRRLATVCEKLPERWREKVAREGHGLADMLDVAPQDAAREHLLMSLRLSEGLGLADYHARWNTEVDEARIAPLVEEISSGAMERGSKLLQRESSCSTRLSRLWRLKAARANCSLRPDHYSNPSALKLAVPPRPITM